MTGELSKISFVTFTRNSEKGLQGLLENVKSIVDEIIVVDGQSTDGTLGVANGYSAKVYERRPWGYPEPDRMFALRQASNEWVLYLDEDERLNQRLGNELKALVTSCDEGVSALQVFRLNFTSKGKAIFGKAYPEMQTRIFRKSKVVYKGLIHESPKISGQIKALPHEYCIIHRYPRQTQAQLMKKRAFRAKLEALEYGDWRYQSGRGKKSRILYRLAPLSVLPMFILFLYEKRATFCNVPSILYTFRFALQRNLIWTMMKARDPATTRRAQIIHEKGLIQLLDLG